MKNHLYLSKGHSMDTLEAVRAHYRNLGIAIRVRYRGPRYDNTRGTCRKADAHSFAVYKK